MKRDVLVLGAGMVGVATAIHLVKRGMAVTLVDRRGAGEETSYGNAGLIQREGLHPYLFPRDLRSVIEVALKQRTDADYHISSLAAVAPFLWRYFRSSNAQRAAQTFAANVPIYANCLEAHQALMEEAGSTNLVAKRGWLRLFRDAGDIPAAERQAKELRDLGLGADMISMEDLNELEPHLRTDALEGALHYRDPWNCSDPSALVKSYAALFEKLGGEFVQAEIAGVTRDGATWTVKTNGSELKADQVVVTLGPWSKRMLDVVGLKLPMGVKRGYHEHFKAAGNAVLSRPVLDSEYGFVIAPMARGLRLTSGAEFARQDAPKTPIQLQKVLPRARDLFPLEESLDAEPWLGSRPVFPDMLPVVGPAPGMPGLWLHFGHGHQGFTLGPATAELIAQMISGETPYADPTPYSAERFKGH
ncbi:FAD-binding oxidoreductase [Oricola sp.]|uniref:NAD(P)/FAD-dependent oxidoreductase n=1 Tax=Oricola sp. TaxID=1979950 RepID=UPI0025EC85A6|nr:FAD-binding oxidoreductase [Oricola sp.]MCI5076249.1 FAD-binding oxidoreductase [Oricola sp.]